MFLWGIGRSCAELEPSRALEGKRRTLPRVSKKARSRSHQSRTNVGPGMCYRWNWSRRSRSASIEVIRRKAQLKLFSLGHRNRNLLDLQEHGLISGVGLWLHAGLCSIRGPVGLLNIDSSLLVCGFATSLKLVVDMIRDFVEQGDSSWRIWRQKSVTKLSQPAQGYCLPAALWMPCRMSGRA